MPRHGHGRLPARGGECEDLAHRAAGGDALVREAAERRERHVERLARDARRERVEQPEQRREYEPPLLLRRGVPELTGVPERRSAFEEEAAVLPKEAISASMEGTTPDMARLTSSCCDALSATICTKSAGALAR